MDYFSGNIPRRAALLGLVGLVVAACGNDNNTAAPPPTATATLVAATATAQPEATPAPNANGPFVFSDHKAAVLAVAWSPDSKTLASGTTGNDRRVLVWDSTSGKVLVTYGGHNKLGIASLDWSPNGTRIASGDGNEMDNGPHAVRVWNPTTGKDLFTCNGHTGKINAVAWSPNGSFIASASLDGTARVWDGATGNLLQTYSGHKAPVAGLAWSPDNKSLISSVGGDISGIPERTIKIWDRASGKELATYHDTQKGAQALAWSAQGKIAMAVNAQIQVTDTTLKDLFSHTTTNPLIFSVTWSPDGKYVVSAGGSPQSVPSDPSQCAIQIWKGAPAATPFKVLNTGKTINVSQVSWSPDNKHIAAGLWDGTVYVWPITL